MSDLTIKLEGKEKDEYIKARFPEKQEAPPVERRFIETSSSIMDEVEEWISDTVEDDYTEQDILQHLAENGCQSGMVNGLIYYSDTCAFYERHKSEISNLLRDMLDDCGCSVSELFGEKWDEFDPLANDTNNQNLLAWFGFEQVASMKGGR